MFGNSVLCAYLYSMFYVFAIGNETPMVMVMEIHIYLGCDIKNSNSVYGIKKKTEHIKHFTDIYMNRCHPFSWHSPLHVSLFACVYLIFGYQNKWHRLIHFANISKFWFAICCFFMRGSFNCFYRSIKLLKWKFSIYTSPFLGHSMGIQFRKYVYDVRNSYVVLL